MNYPTIEQFSLYDNNGKTITKNNTSIVKYNQEINLNGIFLNVECKADFNTIPKEYHQEFLSILKIQVKTINVYSNIELSKEEEGKLKKHDSNFLNKIKRVFK